MLRSLAASSRLLPLLGAALLLATFARTAWVSDDAFISFRVVDNFVSGHGLVWNLDERVQVFTHPLWLLLLSAASALTGEQFFTSLALSAACLLAVVWLVTRLVGDALGSAAILLVLALSRVFADYSSSGLENPLSHVLLLALVYAQQRLPAKDQVRLAWLLCALLVLNRIDLLFLALPIAASVSRRGGLPLRSQLRLAMPALFLLGAWAGFATLYYGSPLPNTYFAKLTTGIDRADYYRQGCRYLADFAQYDPASAMWIGAALVAGLLLPAQRSVALGIGLYVAYIVSVGGDFMSGRFFSAPFVAATAILIAAWSHWRPHPAVAVVAVMSFVLNLNLTLLSPWNYDNRPLPRYGIVDERGFAYRDQGLWRNIGQRRFARSAAATEAAAARAQGSPYVMCFVGAAAYLAGPGVHVIDVLALTDPFLARLPSRWPARVGHYERPIPDGYLQSLRSGEQQLADPQLARLWDEVRLVTRGPVLQPERLAAVVRANTGQWQALVQGSAFARDPGNFALNRPWHCY